MNVAFKTWSNAYRFGLDMIDDVRDADVRHRVRKWLLMKMFKERDKGQEPPTMVVVIHQVNYMVRSMSYRMGVKV